MLEHNDNLSINIGIIDFTQTVSAELKTASLFLPENMADAVTFSDLLMVIEPPTDWLLKNADSLSAVLSCLIISKMNKASNKLTTIQLAQNAPYTHCVQDLADAFNQPSLVGVDLGDFITILSLGSQVYYYQSSWLTAQTIEPDELYADLKEVDAFSDIKGLFTVAALARKHSHSIDAYTDIADVVRDKGNQNTVTACAVRFTLEERGSRVGVIVVV